MFQNFKQFFTTQSSEPKQKKHSTIVDIVIQKSKLLIHSYSSISQQSYIDIQNLIEGEKYGFTSPQATEQFLRYIQDSSLDWTSQLQLLMVIHRLMFDFELVFCEEVLNHRLDTLSSKKFKLPDSSKLLKYDRQQIISYFEELITDHYLNYLMRIGMNFHLYQICRNDRQLPISEDFKLDYRLKFMWMFKISNILNFLLQIYDPLVRALSDYQDLQFLEQLLSLILSDIIYFYNVLSYQMGSMVDRYFQLTAADGMQFYEIFSETYRFTWIIKDFYELNDKCDPELINVEPKYLNVTKEMMKEVQLYYNQVNMLCESSKNIQKDIKDGQTTSQCFYGFKPYEMPEDQKNNDDNQIPTNVGIINKQSETQNQPPNHKEANNQISDKIELIQGNIDQIEENKQQLIPDKVDQMPKTEYETLQENQIIENNGLENEMKTKDQEQISQSDDSSPLKVPPTNQNTPLIDSDLQNYDNIPTQQENDPEISEFDEKINVKFESAYIKMNNQDNMNDENEKENFKDLDNQISDKNVQNEQKKLEIKENISQTNQNQSLENS